MQNFIDDDGLTITRCIEAVDGVCNAMRVTFRPTGARQQKAIEDRVTQLHARGKGSEADDLVSQSIADRIQAWEVLDESGLPIDGIPRPSAEWIDKLHPYLQKRIFLIVWSQHDGGDADPQADEKSKRTSAIEHVEAASGNSAGH